MYSGCGGDAGDRGERRGGLTGSSSLGCARRRGVPGFCFLAKDWHTASTPSSSSRRLLRLIFSAWTCSSSDKDSAHVITVMII